jgi:hypothetical protein
LTQVALLQDIQQGLLLDKGFLHQISNPLPMELVRRQDIQQGLDLDRVFLPDISKHPLRMLQQLLPMEHPLLMELQQGLVLDKVFPPDNGEALELQLVLPADTIQMDSGLPMLFMARGRRAKARVSNSGDKSTETPILPAQRPRFQTG